MSVHWTLRRTHESIWVPNIWSIACQTKSVFVDIGSARWTFTLICVAVIYFSVVASWHSASFWAGIPSSWSQTCYTSRIRVDIWACCGTNASYAIPVQNISCWTVWSTSWNTAWIVIASNKAIGTSWNACGQAISSAWVKRVVWRASWSGNCNTILTIDVCFITIWTGRWNASGTFSCWSFQRKTFWAGGDESWNTI